MRCLLSARFTMTAKVLRQYVDNDVVTGHYEYRQDPESGAIERVWVETDPDDPNASALIIECEVKPIINSGMKGAGTTEEWGSRVFDVEWVKMTFSAKDVLSRRDQITEIRDSTGALMWQEEEISGTVPTKFNIVGVTPIADPFGQHVENMALMRRAEVQI
jgi:hypothetical protein